MNIDSASPLHCCDPRCTLPAAFWLVDMADSSPDGGDSTEMCADHVAAYLLDHHAVWRMRDNKRIRDALTLDAPPTTRWLTADNVKL